MTDTTAYLDPPAPAWVTGDTGFSDVRPVRRNRPANVFTGQAWAELVYVTIGLATSILFFTLTVTLLAVGVGLTVIYVGLPIMALGLLLARAGGFLDAILASVLLDLPIRLQSRIRAHKRGPIGALFAVLRDGGCWRAAAYHVLKLFVAPFAFGFSIAFYAGGLGGLSYWFWQRYLPYQTAPDGSRHRGAEWWPGFFIDTWPRMLALVGVGAIMLALAPKVTRFFTNIDRALLNGLIAGR